DERSHLINLTNIDDSALTGSGSFGVDGANTRSMSSLMLVRLALDQSVWPLGFTRVYSVTVPLLDHLPSKNKSRSFCRRGIISFGLDQSMNDFLAPAISPASHFFTHAARAIAPVW